MYTFYIREIGIKQWVLPDPFKQHFLRSACNRKQHYETKTDRSATHYSQTAVLPSSSGDMYPQASGQQGRSGGLAYAAQQGVTWELQIRLHYHLDISQQGGQGSAAALNSHIKHLYSVSQTFTSASTTWDCDVCQKPGILTRVWKNRRTFPKRFLL